MWVMVMEFITWEKNVLKKYVHSDFYIRFMIDA